MSIFESGVRAFIEWGLGSDTSKMPGIAEAHYIAFGAATESIVNQVRKRNDDPRKPGDQ